MGIVTYKTAYYSFYLPVACGLVLADQADEATLKLAQGICLQMGQYFQVNSDLTCDTQHFPGMYLKGGKLVWALQLSQ